MPKFIQRLSMLGPGLVVAATGLGAGDLVAATVAGAKFGTTILWAVLIGASLKWVLNEGLVRWQLATGTTLIAGWSAHLPRWINWYFLAFLCLWAVLVGAALMAACGLAAHALLPQLSVNVWAAIHSAVALLLVLRGRYQLFENAMKCLIGLMFLTVVSAMLLTDLSNIPLLKPLVIPQVPEGGLALVLGVIGGIGGSVTVLCYGYWMRERGWQDQSLLSTARWDLTLAYALTGLFGMAIMVLAARAQPQMTEGTAIILALADQLGTDLGSGFRWLFLAGFWGAVFSSMLGVWQGVPYLFADFANVHFRHGQEDPAVTSPVDTNSPMYRGFLFFIAIPPLLLLFLGKPVWLVILYSVAGAFFMPFLAATLLYLNNRFLPNDLRNSITFNVLIMVSILLFVFLGVRDLMG